MFQPPPHTLPMTDAINNRYPINMPPPPACLASPARVVALIKHFLDAQM